MFPGRLIPALAILAAAVLAPAAPASTTQELLLEDDHRLLELSRPEQQEALDHFQRLGVDRIRAAVWWGYMVRSAGERRRPPGDPTRSGSRLYRPERWEMLDSLVRGTNARGIGLTLNPAGASGLAGTPLQAPRWAQLRDHAPDPVEFRHFVRALGSRYSGRYVPRGQSAALPAVDDWSIWNEPNNAQFLQPQWKRTGEGWIPWSPVLYRRLYTRAVNALRASGHGRDRIYFGETAATGGDRRGPRASIAPGTFVRELACVRPDLLAYVRGPARLRDCLGYATLRTAGLATHFYSAGSGSAPSVQTADDRDDWVPADPGRPGRLLGMLSSLGRIPHGLVVMNTEAGFQSHPSRPASMSEADQALHTNLAEYLQYREPTIGSFAQYLMTDDPVWHTGLRYMDGRPKDAYAAFRMPIVVRRIAPGALGLGRVVVWGAALGRHAGRGVEVLRDGIPVASVVPVNERGYFEVAVGDPTPGAVYRLRDPRTGTLSRPARVSAGL
jgi:hypothetical protein